MEIKQKVKVIIDGQYQEGIVFSIEEKLGFRKQFPYKNINVKIGDKLTTHHEWDVIEL